MYHSIKTDFLFNTPQSIFVIIVLPYGFRSFRWIHADDKKSTRPDINVCSSGRVSFHTNTLLEIDPPTTSKIFEITTRFPSIISILLVCCKSPENETSSFTYIVIFNIWFVFCFLFPNCTASETVSLITLTYILRVSYLRLDRYIKIANQ